MDTIRKPTLILIAALLVVGGVAGVAYFSQTSPTTIACTQEAKQCPDGSYVGRVGPKCEFAACPSPQETGILKGSMTIGPICPVEQVGHPCTPTPQMYAAHEVFVYDSTRSKLVITLIPDAQGNFSTLLPAGVYVIDVQHQSVGAVQGAPTTLTIAPGKTSTVSISIDTGIR
jgi:hypothetical protein